MKFIGITGGIGAGKSTVLSLLKENFNCKVVQADRLAAQLMTPGYDCYDKVIALPWPDSIIDADGQIDRPTMARFLFADNTLLAAVNGIVHPAVEQEVLNQVEYERKQHNIEYFFFEAALLIECGYGKLVDEMWYIYADEEVRRSRLRASRGYDDARIDSTMSSQPSDDIFRASCDRVIDNSGDREATLTELRRIIDEIQIRGE